MKLFRISCALVAVLTLFCSTSSAQWTGANSGLPPEAVWTYASNASFLFAGTGGGGVFRSADNGATWIPVNSGQPTPNVDALLIHNGVLFAGTNGGGVMKSTDNGDSWTASNTGLTRLVIKSLAGTGSTLYAGTDIGSVFKSTDLGASWTLSSSGLTNSTIKAIHIFGPDVYFGSFHGFFKSTDNGATWSAAVNGLTSTQISAIASNGTKLYAGTGNGVHVSTDAGANWTALNNGIQANTMIGAFAFIGTDIYAGVYGDGILKSTNGGANWAFTNIGLSHLHILNLHLHNGAMFAGTFGGAYRSLDAGQTWGTANNGITSTPTYALSANSTHWFAGTNQGIYRSADQGSSWEKSSTLVSQAFVTDATQIYAGTGSNVHLSADNGSQWSIAGTGMAGTDVRSLVRIGTTLFAGASQNGVYKSTNQGATWTPSSTGITTSLIRSLATDGSALIAATLQGVFVSTDQGANWVAKNNGLTELNVHSVTTAGSTWLVSSSNNGVFRSTDQGSSWTPSNTGLPSFHVRSFSVYGAQIFAATNSGVYHSVNVGLNWVPMNDGLPMTMVNSTKIVGMELIIGTENGIWRHPISELPVGDSQDLTVTVFSTYPTPLHSPCCGQPMTYIVRYENKGTMPVSDASLRFQLSPHTSYQSYTSTPALLSPVSTGPNTKTWDIPGTLQPGESGVIHITALVTCSPPSAPMLVAHARVNPLPGDDTPNDNQTIYKTDVTCSYDPNDKTSIPAGCAPPGFITANDSLIYTIRFQNLGNGNAHQVIVRDTLDADLDLSTIRQLGSSHSFDFSMNGRELVWTFPDIELPWADLDEPGSNGFIRFTVKQNPGNPQWTTIRNKAEIYFDLNEPVITNTTLHTITNSTMPVSAFTVAPACGAMGCSYNYTYTGGTPNATFLWDFGPNAIPQTSTAMNPTGVRYLGAETNIVALRVFYGECWSAPSFNVMENQVTTDIEPREMGPTSTALMSCYPNPFNPTTEITYVLAETGHTRVVVYDLLGREVAVLVNGRMSAGTHRIAFNASGLSSGVYAYRLESGGMMFTKTMSLVK